MQMVLFLVCTIPFWTSNVIRMISWIPLLGRNGLVNQMLVGAHVVDAPVEWLLYSPFSVALAFVHLFTFFMVAPIFNSMMRIDRRLMEAAYDAGASGWQMLTNVIIPLCKPGIAIGSIFVVTIVMGDFITFDEMGGEQIASAGKVIETRLGARRTEAICSLRIESVCAERLTQCRGVVRETGALALWGENPYEETGISYLDGCWIPGHDRAGDA